ncbi:MAG: hypothetical protein R2774_05440 [Saprospiraceae bacterium]
MDSEYIRIKEWPTEHAQKAYDSKNYIEAMQVLHGWIENKLQELLILTGSIDFKMDSSKTWDIANQVSYINAARVLFILSQITETEYQKIIKFNSLRNQIIHKVFHEPYKKAYKGIPRAEYDNVFEQGKELADLLQYKTELKIE